MTVSSWKVLLFAKWGMESPLFIWKIKSYLLCVLPLFFHWREFTGGKFAVIMNSSYTMQDVLIL